MNTYTTTINTEVSIDLGAMWEITTGEYFSECNYWVQRARFDTGNAHPWKREEWTPEHKVALIFENPTGEGWVRKWLTAEDFAEARVKLALEGWTHCGHYGISLTMGDNGYFESDDDACVIDAVVQYACFGEFVFG